jgi:hypothetical protein
MRNKYTSFSNERWRALHIDFYVIDFCDCTRYKVIHAHRITEIPLAYRKPSKIPKFPLGKPTKIPISFTDGAPILSAFTSIVGSIMNVQESSNTGRQFIF